MRNKSLCLSLLSVLTVHCALAAESKQEFCSAYAKRAVQQFQVMQNHPGCRAGLDSLNWRGDYAYHYKACLTFPEFISRGADRIRDTHLHDCGALEAQPAGTAATTSLPTAHVPLASAPQATAAATSSSTPQSAPAVPRTPLAAGTVVGPPLVLSTSLPSSYTLKDVSRIGGKAFAATALNQYGEIAGEVAVDAVLKTRQGAIHAGETHAVLFDGNTLHDVNDNGIQSSLSPPAPADNLTARTGEGINALGWIVGTTNWDNLPYFYDGRVHVITVGTEGISGEAHAINAKGVVVGYLFNGISSIAGSVKRAFVYDGHVHSLNFPADVDSEAVAINDAGRVAGVLSGRSFLYDGTVHVFGGLSPGSWSEAQIIDAHGTIYGFAGGTDRAIHGFAYDGAIHDLGEIAQPRASPRAINTSGVMVGQWETYPAGPLHAFVSNGRQFVDLNRRLHRAPHGVILDDAIAINASGQILATAGYDPVYRNRRHVLLTPSGAAATVETKKACVLPAGPPGGTGSTIVHSGAATTLVFTGLCGAHQRFSVERPTMMAGVPISSNSGGWVHVEKGRQSGIMFNVESSGDVTATVLSGPQLRMLLGR